MNQKPSDRIKEILSTPVNGIYTSETGAILDYLDEQYEQNKSMRNKQDIIEEKEQNAHSELEEKYNSRLIIELLLDIRTSLTAPKGINK